MATHPLFITLKNLKGNARGVVFTEPLWGIPYFLYAPYISIYMLTLGLKDDQIGLIVSISLFFQIIGALLSGAITDKLGRRLTTLLSDMLSWSVPCLIWAVAQNFTYFVIAAVFNGLWRVSATSWGCLLVEDTDPALLVDIYSWIYISGLLAAFFAPIAGLLISTYTLVPTLRGLYLFAFVMMTVKFISTNALTSETKQGRIRMAETKNQSILFLLGEYRGVLGQVLKTPETLYTMGIMLVFNTAMTVNGTFWSIFATTKLQIPAQNLALFPIAKSITMLIFFFLVVPRIGEMHFKKPMAIGFACFVVSQLVLISAPEKGYPMLVLSIILEACSMATVSPMIDRMFVVTVDPKERARIMAIVYVIVIAFTSPFGWIAGALSEVNRILPFILNIIMFAAGGLLAYRAGKASEAQLEAEIEIGR